MALARRLVEPAATENRVISYWDRAVTWPADWPGFAIIRTDMSGFFPEIEVSDPEILFSREKTAFEAMLPRLKEQYPGSYVAVNNGEVRVVGATEAEVVRNFFEQFGDTHVYVGYVGDASPDTYQVSPISFE